LKKVVFSYWYDKMMPAIKSSTEKKQRGRGFCCKLKSDDISPYAIPEIPERDSWTDESSTREFSFNSRRNDRVSYRSSGRGNKNGLLRKETDFLNLPVKMENLKRTNSSDVWRTNYIRRSNWNIYFSSETELTTTTGLHEKHVTTMEDTDWEESEIYTHSHYSQPTTPKRRLRNPSIEEGLFPDVGKEVLVSHISKLGLRYTTWPLNTRVEEIAAWLNLSAKRTSPISEIRSEISCSRDSPTKTFRRKTLSEVFGERLDPSKTGISFFLGPVEGKICFKMCLCDVDKLKSVIHETECILFKEGEKLTGGGY